MMGLLTPDRYPPGITDRDLFAALDAWGSSLDGARAYPGARLSPIDDDTFRRHVTTDLLQLIEENTDDGAGRDELAQLVAEAWLATVCTDDELERLRASRLPEAAS